MMKKTLFLILLFIAFRVSKGQNIVPNGDFEQYFGCPDYVSQIDSAKFWTNANGGTSDYYHECGTGLGNIPNTYLGFQQARSGAGFAGVILVGAVNYSEYIEAPLNMILSAGICYNFEMYINMANDVKYATDAIGVYFSDTIVTSYSTAETLLLTPQINNITGNYPDTLNWTLVSGNYIANGGESYLVIGNFKNNLSSDTILVNPSGYASMAYVYIDDVSLISCPVGVDEQGETEITIYPNPVSDKLNVQLNNNELSEIILYDIASRRILYQEFKGSVMVSLTQFARGVYFYEVRSNKETIKKGKIIKE